MRIHIKKELLFMDQNENTNNKTMNEIIKLSGLKGNIVEIKIISCN